MNNPLRHVGQTARPEEAARTPDEQSGDAGAEARQENQTDNANPPSATAADSQPQHPRTQDTPAEKPPAPLPGKKDIADLEPGEPPPESSAGS